MNFTQGCFFIVLTLVGIAESQFNCTKLCAFIQFPINGSISVDACTTIKQNYSQCSVYVEIDHQRRLATGRLGVEKCTTESTRRIDTIVTFDSSLFSIIRYTCMEDNCDTIFLYDLFPRLEQIPEINTTIIKENINDKIYNPNLGVHNISCSNGALCRDSNFCQGDFTTNSTYNDFTRNGNFACINRLRDRHLLNIKRNYASNNFSTTDIIYRCNLPDCIDKQIMSDLYTWIENITVVPPIDFPEINSNENCTRASTGTSFLVLSHGLIIFATIFLLSY